ncbi:AfsR/SARP family transcriptional regulator [Actinoplanes sp. M2I2]|uniref:AfsR/SARP family transcriptional regulator n=1 Tax=Actinoplanes sp. M2I2 TaxID=1734444 RepID=UPI002021D729|nr:AfsR/SARP family transcriptional regulator [Actinoplanes sp. M2I2]
MTIQRLEVSLLGSVRVARAAADLSLGSPQQRGLLALMALRGTPVDVDEAVSALWGTQPPVSARGTVRTYVARLRRILTVDQAPVLRRAGSGYLLDTELAPADTTAFHAETAQARLTRHSDPQQAVAALRRGLGLWSGPPLTGAHGDFVAAQRTRLLEAERNARELLFELELSLGRHGEVADEIAAAAARYPLDGRFAELLMLSLHRGGRSAEALAAFRRTRARLHEELGMPPSAALEQLHRRILTDDPAILAPSTPYSAGDDSSPATISARPLEAPVQLPADPPDFVGRAVEMRRATSLLTAAGSRVLGLTGLGGSGKTTLAVRLAQGLGSEFPDGRFFIDLGARNEQPAHPHQVLGGFLRSLGVGAEAIPPSLDERIALWRTLTARRRILVVLDDAADSAGITPLLPAGSASAVIVTAWRRMVDLPAARWMRLGAMPEPEALDLLGVLAGRARVDAEPTAAARLVAACSYQPLAVRVAAARLLDRPLWSIERILAQLAEDMLKPAVMHEDCAVVDAPFRLAEKRLQPAAGTALRLGSLPDEPVRTVDELATMLDVSHGTARGLLEDLVDAHLIEPVDADSYRFPDLIQAYSRRRAVEVEGAERCQLARSRLAAERVLAAAGR